LPSPPHERLALLVFVRARRLAHEDEPSVGITDTEDDVLPVPVQLTACALTQLLPHLGERQGRCRRNASALRPSDVKALDPQSLLVTQMGASLLDQFTELVDVGTGHLRHVTRSSNAPSP
jgi:hypothetical protein